MQIIPWAANAGTDDTFWFWWTAAVDGATGMPFTLSSPARMHSLRPVPMTMASYSPSASAGYDFPAGDTRTAAQ